MELCHLTPISSPGCLMNGRLLKSRRVRWRKDGHSLALFPLFFCLGIHYQPSFELFFLCSGIGNRPSSCCDPSCQVATSWCCEARVSLIYGKILLLIRGKGDEGGNGIWIGKNCPSVWNNREGRGTVKHCWCRAGIKGV